ncbi:MAG TPA: hypothetical protein VJU84_17120 [Pyrinomonadaceae bacterium]|nr:hypothetical protein [Pyrinomonadaceae bacterium]
MTKSKDTYSVSDLVDYLHQYSTANPGISKQEITSATVKRFQLTKRRKVYVGPNFAIRFSSARSESFSNTVLSLSALQPLDETPFLVCIVRPAGVQILLANSTFLKKVSHSSQKLRADRIRGSFLGHDILRSFADLENTPANFEELFSYHREFTWEENLQRLVEATGNIVPTGARFAPSNDEVKNIVSVAEIASALSSHPQYLEVERNLNGKVAKNRREILRASEVDIDNINYRGNRIEQLITEAGNVHGLGDLTFSLEIGTTLVVDVKTKIINLSSSPKGYNIEKLLKTLANGNTTFSFFFIGVDMAGREVHSRLVSFLDQKILDATKIQFHWAGRNSRGVTQLAGDLSTVFSSKFSENVEVPQAKAFLKQLIDLESLTADDSRV